MPLEPGVNRPMDIKLLGTLAREIDIAECVLVAKGKVRNVYEHSNLPGLLIKTLRPDVVDDAGFFNPTRRLKRLRPVGAYFVFQRELTEFIIQCRRRFRRDTSRLPIPQLYGLVRTSNGIGLVVEKVATANGGLAPTLRELVQSSSFDDKHRRALERFFVECTKAHAVFGDLNAGNLVYTETRDPAGEFVCIDGFGEKAFIPIHRWSRFCNSRMLARARRKMLNLIALGPATQAEVADKGGPLRTARTPDGHLAG